MKASGGRGCTFRYGDGFVGSLLYNYFYGRDSFNEQLFLLVNRAFYPFLDHLMPIVTRLGSSGAFILYFAILALLCLVNRRLVPAGHLVVYLLAAIISTGIEDYLKELFQVPRPPLAIGLEQVRVLGSLSHSFSLPSGHAVFAFMTATVIGHGRRRRWKAVLFLLALLVAYSRVYLGVHYPLDVLAGALVGAGCGLIVWRGYEWGEEYISKHRRSESPPDAGPEK